MTEEGSGALPREIPAINTPTNPAPVEAAVAAKGHPWLAPVDASSFTTTKTTGGGPAPPLTIFYNGTVSVFHVSLDMARSILRVADNAEAMDMRATKPPLQPPPPPPPPGTVVFDLPNGDLPLKRTLSLQRFFQRRKERLSKTAPYQS